MVVRYEFAPVIWGEELPSTKQTQARVQPGKKKTCIDCGADFVLTPGEEQFFRDKGINEPKRCNRCQKTESLSMQLALFRGPYSEDSARKPVAAAASGVKELKESKMSEKLRAAWRRYCRENHAPKGNVQPGANGERFRAMELRCSRVEKRLPQGAAWKLIALVAAIWSSRRRP